MEGRKMWLQTPLDSIMPGHAFLIISEPCQPWVGLCRKEGSQGLEVSLLASGALLQIASSFCC